MKKFLTKTIALLLAVTMLPATAVSAKEYTQPKSTDPEMDALEYECIWKYPHRYDNNAEIMAKVDAIKARTTELKIGTATEYTVTDCYADQWFKVMLPEDCKSLHITFNAIDKIFREDDGRPIGGWMVHAYAENMLPHMVYCETVKNTLYKDPETGEIYDTDGSIFYGCTSHSARFGLQRTYYPDCEDYADDKTDVLGIFRGDRDYTDDTWYIHVVGGLCDPWGRRVTDYGSCYSILCTEAEKVIPEPEEPDDPPTKKYDDEDINDNKDDEEFETDKNNSYKTATVLKTTRKDSLASKKDTTDWFRFNVTEKGIAKLDFIAAPVDRKGWNIKLYRNPAAKPLQTIANADYSRSMKLNVKKGTYYVKISATKSSEAIGRDYKLKLKMVSTPSKTRLVSAKAGKKAVTLRWTRSKNASGYYVYRTDKKNGKYTKIATVPNKRNKYVDKKSLTSKKTYYYKITAYRTEKGLTAKASASNIKTAKIK